MVKDKNGKEVFNLAPNELKIVDRIRTIITEEDDEVWGIFYGARGSGKSLKAQRMAYAIDPSLDIEHVCFNKEEFIPIVIKSKRRAVIGDEGISLFQSRQVMTKEGRLISELSDQIRQNNLFIPICIPSLVDLDKSILFNENMKFVCKVWKTKSKTKDGFKVVKGNAAYYLNLPNDNRVQKLINYEFFKNKKGRKAPRPNFHFTVKGDTIKEGKFVYYPVGEAAYRKKKEAVLDKYKVGVKKEEKITNKQLVGEMMKREPNVTKTKLAEVLNISRQHLYRCLPKNVTKIIG